MPWGWDGTGEKSVALGGRRGTVEEAAEAKAWPSYEVEYLQKRLDYPLGKYSAAERAEPAVKDHILLEKAAEDYKEEADECLKAEFKDWLAGRHPDNVEMNPYENAPGKPVRRHTYRGSLTNDPGAKIGDPMLKKADGEPWRPTWWGQEQLTHLPGVRAFLREGEKRTNDADMYMNLLAEHGPQDLKSAWMYFKHWVKARPIAPEICTSDIVVAGDLMDPDDPSKPIVTAKPQIGGRSDFGHNPSQGMQEKQQWNRNNMEPELEPELPGSSVFSGSHVFSGLNGATTAKTNARTRLQSALRYTDETMRDLLSELAPITPYEGGDLGANELDDVYTESIMGNNTFEDAGLYTDSILGNIFTAVSEVTGDDTDDDGVILEINRRPPPPPARELDPQLFTEPPRALRRVVSTMEGVSSRPGSLMSAGTYQRPEGRGLVTGTTPARLLAQGQRRSSGGSSSYYTTPGTPSTRARSTGSSGTRSSGPRRFQTISPAFSLDENSA